MTSNTSIKERLLAYIRAKGLSVRRFELACGLSNGYVNNIRQSISPARMQSIALKNPDLNPAWLMTGEGEMLRSGGTSIVQGDGCGAAIGGGDVTINHAADLSAEVAVLRERNRLLQEIINAKDQLIEELRKNK